MDQNQGLKTKKEIDCGPNVKGHIDMAQNIKIQGSLPRIRSKTKSTLPSCAAQWRALRFLLSAILKSQPRLINNLATSTFDSFIAFACFKARFPNQV